MEYFEDFESFLALGQTSASDYEDDGSTMQANMVTASPYEEQASDHQSTYLLPSTDRSWTLPYTSSSTGTEYGNFTNTGYTHWNEIKWDDDYPQASQLASFGDAESFAHTLNPSLDECGSSQEEHFNQTSCSHSSPFLHPPRNAPVYTSASQGMPDGRKSMFANPNPLPNSNIQALSLPHDSLKSSNIMIGSMYAAGSPDSYIFKCHDPKCASLSFKRWYDFKRNYNGSHAAAPTVYWCDFEGCPRSRGVGDRPFTRKDKVKDHVDSVHGEDVVV